VQLSIPKETIIVVGEDITGDNLPAHMKCRASQLRVLEFFGITTDKPLLGRPKVYAGYDNGFQYIKGAVVQPTVAFNNLSLKSCASGIHFFFDKKAAKGYTL
jgi:hypothetical protein